jgi:site-specific recombinase XerD
MTKRPPVPILKEDVEQLISACNNGATGLRNKALLDLLHRSGIRISEALALMPSDIEPIRVRIRHGKGNRDRVAGIVGGGSAWLAAWLREREHHLGLNGRQPVFCTLSGEQISSRYVRAMLSRLAKRAGIDKSIRCHGLRHGFATLLAERQPLRVVSAALGHQHLSTTENYVSRLTGGDAAARVAAIDF